MKNLYLFTFETKHVFGYIIIIMDKNFNILIINGPNINMLGVREPEQYGSKSYKDLEMELHEYSFELGVNIEIFQSNFEGEIVEKIQYALGNFDGIILNAGAYTHTSIAIRDALTSVKIPTVEVHISNIYKRDEFRHHSMFADICVGQITGFKIDSYRLGMQGLLNFLTAAND